MTTRRGYNAGYAALDAVDFKSAFSYFSKALQLFSASKKKHTGTQELDVCWGTILAEYYSGDTKDAESVVSSGEKRLSAIYFCRSP